jgi:hypothetical protein
VISVCVAFKAHQGWVNSVAVRLRSKRPEPLLCARIDLFVGQGREVVEPYHVAGGWDGLARVPCPDDPARLIGESLKRQARATRARLKSFSEEIRKLQLVWSYSVMLTGRGRLGDDLEHILGSHAQIHIAEGEAVRRATRKALQAMGIVCVDQDEKSIPGDAAERLGQDANTLDHLLKPMKPATARTWTREERLLALGAWINAQRV